MSAGLAIFSAIYEFFSHGVYSAFMIGLFALPLVLGAIPAILAIKFENLRIAHPWQHLIHNFAIATLVVGSALQGVMEIYGTTYGGLIFYAVAGGGMLLASFVMWFSKFAQIQNR